MQTTAHFESYKNYPSIDKNQREKIAQWNKDVFQIPTPSQIEIDQGKALDLLSEEYNKRREMSLEYYQGIVPVMMRFIRKPLKRMFKGSNNKAGNRKDDGRKT